MTAPVDVDEFLAAEMAVLQALSMAGKRCRNVSRERRKMLVGSTPDHRIYEHLLNADSPAGCDRLLEGAWDHLRLVLPGRADLVAVCDGYVRNLLVRRAPHTRDGLLEALRRD